MSSSKRRRSNNCPTTPAQEGSLEHWCAPGYPPLLLIGRSPSGSSKKRRQSKDKTNTMESHRHEEKAIRDLDKTYNEASVNMEVGLNVAQFIRQIKNSCNKSIQKSRATSSFTKVKFDSSSLNNNNVQTSGPKQEGSTELEPFTSMSPSMRMRVGHDDSSANVSGYNIGSRDKTSLTIQTSHTSDERTPRKVSYTGTDIKAKDSHDSEGAVEVTWKSAFGRLSGPAKENGPNTFGPGNVFQEQEITRDHDVKESGHSLSTVRHVSFVNKNGPLGRLSAFGRLSGPAKGKSPHTFGPGSASKRQEIAQDNDVRESGHPLGTARHVSFGIRSRPICDDACGAECESKPAKVYSQCFGKTNLQVEHNKTDLQREVINYQTTEGEQKEAPVKDITELENFG